MSTCLDLVRREIADLTEKELDEVLEQMRQHQARFMAQGADAGVAAAQAGRELADTLRAAIAIERRNAALNYRIRTEALDYIQTYWADDPAEGVLALIYGSPKARFGSRASVNAAQDAFFRKYAAGVAGELEQAGLFDVLRRGELDRDVARAMWSINDEAALARLPRQAVDIARILRKWQEVARLDANRHGAWIGKLDHYVVRQSHHPDRLIEAGEAEWKAFIRDRLDFTRTFPNGPPEDLDAWLHETFLNLTTGVRPKGEADFNADRMAAFKGPGNLAKRLSQERVLHFRDADSWFDYNERFGFGNLREAYIHGLHRAAESNGLMQVLGTNPEYNLQSVVDALRARLSREDPGKLEEFDRNTRRGERIENALREVQGLTRMVASRRLATIGAGLRVWNTLTGLGGAVLSAVTDVPIRASALRYQGQSYLAELGRGLIAPLRRIVGAVGDAERRATLSAVGYFNEMALGNLATRFSPDESVPGRLHRALHTFFKWNLLGAWTDEMRRTSLESMARFFGELSDTAFGDLSERTRRTLERFRIGEREWNVIRQGIRTESGGEKFLTPQAVRELPRETFADLAADRINALKTGLVERIRKRAQADQREQEWVRKRSERLQQDLARAQQRLAERMASLDAREADRLRAIQDRLVALYSHLDVSRDYWNGVRGRLPNIGELRRIGIQEGRAQLRAAELRAVQRRVLRDLESFREDLESAFIEKWLGKESALQRALETADDLRAADLAAQFDQMFTEAHASLTERLAKADERGQARIQALQERLAKAQEKITSAQQIWQRARAALPKASELRSAGVSEGRAKEVARQLKDEAREVGREFEKLRKELNEEFIEKWSELQDELVAFSERIDKRIAERAEQTAREIADLEPQINRILEDTRENIADRLQQLYADELNAAVISPDARTLAVIRQGKQAGTPIGEALRLFWQFKSFGIAIMQRAFLREFYGYGLGRGERFGISEIRGLALLMLGSLGFGYVAMSAKDMLKGRKPRPVDDWRTWSAAMAQGGGLGIYGDFLFGEANRFGQGFLQTVGGPTLSKADQIYRLWSAVRRGEDVGAQALRFTINNTPYANLFYTRMAADYLFLYELQEAMNPGYLRRMERRVQQETGAEWWLRPSEVAR